MTTTPHEGKRRDYRCTHCGRLLFRAYLADHSQVNTRCPKCGAMVVIKRNGKSVEQSQEVGDEE